MRSYAEVLIELLRTEDGGRRTSINLSNDVPAGYRPHFRIRGGDGEYLGVEFVDGPDEPLQPGGKTYATVRLMYEPRVSYADLVQGTEFEILEGGQVVGTGIVTRRE